MKPCMCTQIMLSVWIGQSIGYRQSCQQAAHSTALWAPSLLSPALPSCQYWMPFKEDENLSQLTWNVSRSVTGGVLQGESSGAMSVHSLSKFSTLSTCPTLGRKGDDTSLFWSFSQLRDLQVHPNKPDDGVRCCCLPSMMW